MFSRKRRTSAPRSARLQLESLEIRLVPAGTWTPLTNPLPDPTGAGISFMLPNGTVMVAGSSNGSLISNLWYALTPDSSGNYADGTWSQLASMSVQRVAFGSALLNTDQLFVVGGEYASDQGFSRSAEIYSMSTNSWKTVPSFPQPMFGDDPVMTLPNGKLLAGYLGGPQTYFFDPTTDTWSQAATKLFNDQSDEETWVKLPNGDILDYSIFSSLSSGQSQAQYYDPNTNTWNLTGPVPVQLSEAYTPQYPYIFSELGPGMVLPNGLVFQLGALPNTALYDYRTNTWSAGPTIPNGVGCDDAEAGELPDGQVIFFADPGWDTGLSNPPATLYDYDYTTNSITQLTDLPSQLQNTISSNGAFVNGMLALPTGQLLLTNHFSDQMWLYSDGGTTPSSSLPVVTGISNIGKGSFTITGTQLTGTSSGVGFGDDICQDENYPLVSLTDTNGNVVYTTTSDWSSEAVLTGATPVTATFTEPNNIGPGAYLLTVNAAGVASEPALFVQMGAGATNVSVEADGSGHGTAVFSGSTQIADFSQSSFSNIFVVGDSGNDTLTIGGDPVPAGGQMYYDGGGGTDTLVGPDSDSTWQITDTDTGTLNGNIQFTNVQNLTGGSGADDFVIQGGTQITGKVDGGPGFDTLDLSQTGQGIPPGLIPGTIDGFQDLTGAPPSVSSFDNINFINTVGTHLAISTQPPVATTIGTPFGLVVEVEDGNNNLNPTYNGPLTIALANNPSGATLGGTLTINTVNGVGTFSGLTLNKPGLGYTLTVSSTSLPSVTTNSFNVATNTPTKVVVAIEPPTSIASEQVFTVVAKAEDDNGFLASTYSGSITIQIANNPAGGTLGGTTTINFINGVAKFSNLTLDKVGLGYTLRLTSTSPLNLTSATTTAINVTPGAASQLVIATQPPSNVVAGDTFGLSVVAEDSGGNLVPNFTGQVTIGVTPDGTYGGIANGVVTVRAQSGVATFSSIYLNLVGTGSLTAFGGGLAASVPSSPITVQAGQASQLVFISDPPNIKAGGSFPVVVWAADSQGNLAVGYNGPVVLSMADNPTGGVLSGNLSTTANGGVASFTGLRMTTAGTGYDLLASTPAGQLTPGISSQFSVVPLLATHLAVTTQPPTSGSAGALFTTIVSGEDQYGNIDPTFHSTVSIALSTNPTNATLGGTLIQTAGGGSATFNDLQIVTAGTGYVLEALSGSFVATSNAFTITPAAPTQFIVVNQPASTTVNSPVSFSVIAEDQYGNVVTTFRDNVKAVIGTNAGNATLSGTTSVNASNGVASFPSLALNKPGVGYTLTATSNGLAAGTNAFNVIAGTADHLFVATQPPASVTAGTGFGLTVWAEDPFGNLDPTYNGTVSVGFANNPGSSTLGGFLTVQAHSGIATFSDLTLTVADPGYALQVTSNTLTMATTAAINVTAAPASRLVVTATAQPPSSISAGNFFGFTVSAEDVNGNVNPNFTGNITVSLANNPGGSTLGGTLVVPVQNGMAVFSGLTLNKVGTGYTLQLTNPNLVSTTTNPVTVNAGTSTHLVLTGQPPTSVLAGQAFGFTVKAEDGSGNVDTTFNGSVTVSQAVNSGGSLLGGFTTVKASAGVAVFSGLTLNKVGTGYVLQAASQALGPVNSSAIKVTANSATQLFVTTQPASPVLVGGNFNFAVTAEDPYGNIDPNFTGTVNVSMGNNPGNANLTGTLNVAAVNGVATFTGLSIDAAGNGDTLQVTSGTLAPTTTAPFSAVLDVPTTTATLSGTLGSNGWYTSAVQVSFSWSDPISKVTGTYYQIDGGTTTQYNGSPFLVSGDGIHTVTYESVNKAGNQELTKTKTISIDSSLPTTQASVAGTMGSAGWYKSPVKVTLNAIDNTSGVAATYYTVDGGTAAVYTAPFQLTIDGTHTISYYSVDVAGNKEVTNAFFVKVDSTPPTTTASLTGTLGNNSIYRSAVKVTLNPSDSASGPASTYYRLSTTAAWTLYRPGSTITVSKQGSTTIYYYSIDVAGNSNKAANDSTTFTIDSVPPPLTVKVTAATANNFSSVPVSGTSEVGAAISITVTDKNGKFVTVSTTAGAKGIWSDTFDTSSLANGTLTIQVTATDAAGNLKKVTLKTTRSA